ncbi:MAG: hypothetical protein OXF65_10965 [Acidimicrobiaceae bacterium]|nr:hypothetical protein [Acidimicrobiaceae bacterium]
MSTIDTVTDSGQAPQAEPATPQPAPEAPAASAPEPAPTPTPATSAPAPAAATADSPTAANRFRAAGQPRSLLIPLPTAITAALVAGLFGLLFLNLNSLNDNITTLRDDMNGRIDSLDAKIDNKIDSLRDDMNERIDSLDAKIDNKTDSLRDEMLTVLLDHTDRLARIETHLDLRPHTDTTDP